MKYIHLVFDLDDTLIGYRPDSSGQKIQQELALLHEVPAEDVHRMYKIIGASADDGFSPDNLARAVHAEFPHVDYKKFSDDLHHAYSSALMVYSDTHELLDFARQKNITMSVVTAGNNEWQRHKMNYTGIEISDIHVTKNIEGKVAALAKIQAQMPDKKIIFIDDYVRHLDEAHDAFGDEIELYRMLRPTSRYAPLVSKYPHQGIESLAELITFLEERF